MGPRWRRVGCQLGLVPACPLDSPRADAVPWLYAALSLIKYFWWGGGEQEGCGAGPPCNWCGIWVETA